MAGRPVQSPRPVPSQPRSDLQPSQGSRPRLIQLGSSYREAILMLLQYVAQATGIEPTQEEIADVLKSYFTLNEVSNQINYLRKKPADRDPHATDPGSLSVSLRINLGSRPPKNSLAKAGFFIPSVGEGITAIRKHAKAMHGLEPSDDEIARSLRSSFILSELKNQIVHSRKHPRKDSK